MRRPDSHADVSPHRRHGRRAGEARSGWSARATAPVVVARLIVLALILAGAWGCDKARDLLRAGQAAVPPQVLPGEATDLDGDPQILFQVFGELGAPRMIPIAIMRDGTLSGIRLDQDGWNRFDDLFLRSGKVYGVFHDGRQRGDLTVEQGMWETDESLYSLPGCRTLTPIAAVGVRTDVRHNFTVELLASNAPLGAPRAGRVPPTAELSREARRVARLVGVDAGIPEQLLDSLDFHARALHTGLAWPTIVASFIDPSPERARSASMRTAHVFVIANADVAGVYHPTYVHARHEPLARGEYRRFFDHLDVTGDGVSEIVIEGWQFGGDTFMAVLALRDGIWEEIFRTRSNWCLDERPRN